jgi:GNAT superfamily N-acetyltransferase
MAQADLDAVLAIENAIYTHPWTRGNFADSLRAGYCCSTWRQDREVLGYFVLLAAAGEAHLLNLSIAPGVQRRGHGAALLREAMRLARELGAGTSFWKCDRATRRGRPCTGAGSAHRGAPRLLPGEERARGRMVLSVRCEPQIRDPRERWGSLRCGS